MGSLRSANATVVVLVIGTTALVLSAVTCTLYFFSLPSSTQLVPHRLVGRLQGADGGPLVHTRQLFCVYDVYGSKGAQYDISDVPTEYCNNVVVCCITERDLDKDPNIISDLRYFLDTTPAVKVYIGVFAEGGRGSWLFDVLSQPKGGSETVDSFNTFITKHHLNGGVYMWVPNTKDFRNIPNAIRFINDLSTRLRLYSLELVFTLPNDVEDLVTHFTVEALRGFHGKFVKITHSTPRFNVTDQKVPCSTPWKAWASQDTLEQAIRSLGAWHFFDSANASSKVLMSMDTVTYTYVQKKDFPYILTERMVAPYRDFCTVCSRVDKTVKFWKVYQDKGTKCRVAATEGTVRSSADPALIQDMLRFYYNTLPGIVVHNVHLDDFTGVCGPRHGFIKSVYCQLEGMGREKCDLIGV